MAEVTVNGVRLAYELHGRGEPVVLLPGLGMVKEAWLAGPAPALADAGYQVVLVDNRGVGASDAPPAPYTVADLAADTVGLIDQLGLAPCSLPAGWLFAWGVCGRAPGRRAGQPGPCGSSAWLCRATHRLRAAAVCMQEPEGWSRRSLID